MLCPPSETLVCTRSLASSTLLSQKKSRVVVYPLLFANSIFYLKVRVESVVSNAKVTPLLISSLIRVIIIRPASTATFSG